MRLDNADLREGARRIISQNLGLRPSEDVVIIIDEVTHRVGRILSDGARYYGVRATNITVYQRDQTNFFSNHNFPLPLARAIDSAHAVTISLSDWPEGTGFRRYLLDLSRQFKTKVALMPGITLDMIAGMAHLDYGLLLSNCNALHIPFLIGNDVLITTFDKDGISHELRMKLGSWAQPPNISSGIVHPQSFDNIPSGEVYIAPLKGSANGEIIINGSITGYVFIAGDEIRLKFRDGVLQNMVPHEHPAAVFLLEAIAKARAQGDKEPDFLCELGVGVVPGIVKLTGNTLVDEKVYSTAHIAIGINKPFGGDVNAQYIHEDMIFHHPTISIDGNVVVSNGEISVKDSIWRYNYKNIDCPPPYNKSIMTIGFTGVEAEIAPGDILRRVYFDGTDARVTVQVGDNETAHLAAMVHTLLPESGNISLEDLSKAARLSPEVVRPLLYIMGELFGLVEIFT